MLSQVFYPIVMAQACAVVLGWGHMGSGARVVLVLGSLHMRLDVAAGNSCNLNSRNGNMVQVYYYKVNWLVVWNIAYFPFHI